MKNIFITEGDPTGVSYEILEKSSDLLQMKSSRFNFIFVTSQKKIQSKFFNKFPTLEKISDLEKAISQKQKNQIFSFRKNILSPKKEMVFGKPSTHSGKVAYTSLLSAIELQKKFGGDIITLPLSKEWVIASGIKDFSGHTEVFAEEYGVKTFMLMHGKKLKVIPLTTHIPLSQVSKSLRKVQIIPMIKAIQNSKLLRSPKIGFCGLNPHAGENGKIGKEEITIILPLIQEMKRQGLDVHGPIPADSLFIPEIAKNFDLIFACYHDQGLIPFKAMEGKNGINVTLGLDFIRVSPDHGTAFDIVGKNIADPRSLIQCIKVLTSHDIH